MSVSTTSRSPPCQMTSYSENAKMLSADCSSSPLCSVQRLPTSRIPLVVAARKMKTIGG